MINSKYTSKILLTGIVCDIEQINVQSSKKK